MVNFLYMQKKVWRTGTSCFSPSFQHCYLSAKKSKNAEKNYDIKKMNSSNFFYLSNNR